MSNVIMSKFKQILFAVLLFQVLHLSTVNCEVGCDSHSNLLRPSRVLDQHFGLVLDPDDFFEPLVLPRWLSRSVAGYLRPWRSEASRGDIGSTISLDKDKFQVNLDVQQFKPEEISVKYSGDNEITIEGKHEEQQDEHGYISRHFIRRYVLPKNCDASKIESKLSSDGVLTISAPTETKEIDYKEIPIQQTGQPARQVENKDRADKGAEKGHNNEL